MAYDKVKALAALAAFQEYTGLKDDPWEKASEVGEGTLRRFRGGQTNSLRDDTINKLATGASKVIGKLFHPAHIRGDLPLVGPGDVPPPLSAVVAGDADATQIAGRSAMTAVHPLPGPPDIPVWASAQAGTDGAIILVPDPIDYIRRSERMQFVRNPFAFNVLGDSMSPAIEHGDQVVVNPSVVAAPGNDCVFIHEGPEGMLALIKRLLRPRTNGWQVRQFNPPKDFEIPKAKWSRVHAISEVRKRGVG